MSTTAPTQRTPLPAAPENELEEGFGNRVTTAEALRRERYASRVRAEFAALRADPQAWQQYLADAELTAVTDGVD